MAAVIIEIFSRGRGQPQFRRVHHFPYRIGRAYDNDLILNDDSVSAHHLQLEQDDNGNVMVRNLSHENGSVMRKRKLGFVPQPTALPVDIYAGHTHLRLVDPQAQVPAAKRVQHTPGMSWFLSLPVSLTLLFAVLLMNTFMVFHEQIEQKPWYDILTRQIPEIFSPLILATITGFISRVLLHRWQYPLHLSIACIAIILARGSVELSSLTSYYFSSHVAAVLLNNLIAATLYTALFAWQLRAFSTLSRERATFTSVAIVWPLLLLFWLQAYLRAPDFKRQPELHTVLRVSDFRQQENVSLTEYFTLVKNELEEGTKKEIKTSRKESELSEEVEAE